MHHEFRSGASRIRTIELAKVVWDVRQVRSAFAVMAACTKPVPIRSWPKFVAAKFHVHNGVSAFASFAELGRCAGNDRGVARRLQ